MFLGGLPLKWFHLSFVFSRHGMVSNSVAVNTIKKTENVKKVLPLIYCQLNTITRSISGCRLKWTGQVFAVCSKIFLIFSSDLKGRSNVTSIFDIQSEEHTSE